MSDTCDVPLLEVLDSVPLNGRAVWMVSTTESRNIPYGNICQQAAMRIRQLELAEAKADVEEWNRARLERSEHNKSLQEKLTAHKAALEKCEEILDMTIRDQPACDGGSLYYEHYDGEGNYTGSESIDPIGAYGRLLGEITKALSEIAKLKGTK